jgi:hypothetical protein
VLLPNKDGASTGNDYMSVSLMHSVAKIAYKMLATRLWPELKILVSTNQSAFTKTRCIQDNFLYVKGVIKLAHKKKKLMVPQVRHCKGI